MPPEGQNDIARLLRLEWKAEEQEKRLEQGANAFADVRDGLEEMKKSIHNLHGKLQKAEAPRPFPWPWVVGFAFTAIMTAGGLLWAFAQYPDEEDFSAAQKVNTAAHRGLDAEMDGLKDSQVTLATEQRLIKQSQANQDASLKSIDKKLDEALTRRNR